MIRNSKLFNASLYLYKAATFLRDIKKEEHKQVLQLAQDILNEVEITEADEIEHKKVDKYAKIIKGK